MGICLMANNRKGPFEWDMGYGSFYYMRKEIGGWLGGKSYYDWLETNNKTPKDKLHEICTQFCSNVGEAAYNFLTQEDGQGSISHKECKELLDAIKDIPGGTKYGYVFSEHTICEFKELLQYCYSHRTKLVWR